MNRTTDATVLLVDDEQDFLDLVDFEFRRNGYRTRVATSGLEALDVFANEEIALIVSDIRMNNGDGLELLTHLKSDNLHDPSVILVSGVEDIRPRVAYHLGAEAVIAKPCRLSGLLETAERLLQSPGERWSRRNIGVSSNWISHQLSDFSMVTLGKSATLGRGGMFLDVSGRQPALGSRLVFKVEFDSENGLREIEGAGTIRWAETDPETLKVMCGIEFDFLSDETRGPTVDWIQSRVIVPYIPAGPIPEPVELSRSENQHCE